jgi:hypothetical protein
MVWTWLLNKNTWVVAGVLIIVMIAFYQGASWQQYQCQAKFSAQRERLIQQLQIEQTRAHQASVQYEAEKAARTQDAQLITKEVTRVIQKPIYHSCRLDADGLSLLQSAIY